MAAAGVLVWAGALLDLGGAHDRPRRASSSGAAGNAASARAGAGARVAGPGARPGEPPAAAPQSSRAPGARTNTGAAVPPPPPGRGDVRVIGSRPATSTPGVAPAPSARGEQPTPVDPDQNAERGELGEGVLSPEYTEIEESYVNEPRDGAWATAQEQRVRAVLGNSAVAKGVALVHCQESVCRIVLQTDTADAFQQLLQVPGLSAATGVGPSTPYSLRGGQLSVYFHVPREDSTAARK